MQPSWERREVSDPPPIGPETISILPQRRVSGCLSLFIAAALLTYVVGSLAWAAFR